MCPSIRMNRRLSSQHDWISPKMTLMSLTVGATLLPAVLSPLSALSGARALMTESILLSSGAAAQGTFHGYMSLLSVFVKRIKECFEFLHPLLLKAPGYCRPLVFPAPRDRRLPCRRLMFLLILIIILGNSHQWQEWIFFISLFCF